MTKKKETILAVKGFDSNLQCRGYQFKIGKKYKHEGSVERCSSGFHSCEAPLDVFGYYPPAGSRYALVEVSGKIDRETDGDTKIASAEIHIKAELKIPELVSRAIDYIMARIEKTAEANEPHSHVHNSGDYGAASNSGDYGAASNSGTRGAASNSGTRGAASNSGYGGAASNSGDYGAASNSGDYGAASNSGDYGAASNSGDYGAASNSGYGGAASNSGTRGAASNSGYGGAASNSGYGGAASNSGTRGAASNSGYGGAASNSGTRGAASNSGYGGAASTDGEHSTAMHCGYAGKVKGADGCALFLVERDDDFRIVNVWSGIVGTDGIKPEVFYTLKNGKPVEVK
jgi:hypothetical protein